MKEKDRPIHIDDNEIKYLYIYLIVIVSFAIIFGYLINTI